MLRNNYDIVTFRLFSQGIIWVVRLLFAFATGYYLKKQTKEVVCPKTRVRCFTPNVGVS